MDLRHGAEKTGGGWKINVQCLTGPLLRVMESEMSRKAARIRSKDLSDRDATSSEVIPFVSIFGRIFNLMIPAGQKPPKNFRVRSLGEHRAVVLMLLSFDPTQIKKLRTVT